jgi:hypothetical protein
LYDFIYQSLFLVDVKEEEEEEKAPKGRRKKRDRVLDNNLRGSLSISPIKFSCCPFSFFTSL